MKKRNTFLAGLLILMFSASAVAQDLVIPTNSESGVEIMKMTENSTGYDEYRELQ